VIYAASSSAYGDTPGELRRESAPCRPLSPYAAAKLAGEHYCASFGSAFGLPTVRLRLFNVFGPRQRGDSPYAGVIPRFLTALSRGQPPVVHGDGLQSRDFTYVDNVVQAFLLAAQAPSAVGNVYNIGGGKRTSIRELLAELNRLWGHIILPACGPSRAADVRHSLADFTRARQDLRYEPLVTFAAGLRRTVASWRIGASAE
jgi:UDP-glucose 4-epimerase